VGLDGGIRKSIQGVERKIYKRTSVRSTVFRFKK